MKVMTYNTLFAGFDGTDDRRRKLQVEMIREVSPDILLFQEAKNFTADGSRLLYETEDLLGMRGLLATAPATGQNTAIFIKAPIRPLAFETDAIHFHHAAAIAKLDVPGLDKPLTAISVHLCPLAAHVRLREAAYLASCASSSSYVLITGDFNNVPPGAPEPALDQLPPHFRARYIGEDGKADRRAIKFLYEAGFVDIAEHLGKGDEATVPTKGFPEAEFVPFRCDYILASPPLAERAEHVGVLADNRTGLASDHYPVVATFR